MLQSYEKKEISKQKQAKQLRHNAPNRLHLDFTKHISIIIFNKLH